MAQARLHQPRFGLLSKAGAAEATKMVTADLGLGPDRPVLVCHLLRGFRAASSSLCPPPVGGAPSGYTYGCECVRQHSSISDGAPRLAFLVLFAYWAVLVALVASAASIDGPPRSSFLSKPYIRSMPRRSAGTYGR